VSALYKEFEGYSDLHETIFVFEMIRHGARTGNGLIPSIELENDEDFF
jgi:hypothetical protein